MEKRGLGYFENITKLKIPEQTVGQYDEAYSEMCHLYWKARHTAGEVLNGDLLEEIGEKEIKGLLKKINKLSKDTIFEKIKRR